MRIGKSYCGNFISIKPFSDCMISNPFSIVIQGIAISGFPTNIIPHSRAKGLGESILSGLS